MTFCFEKIKNIPIAITGLLLAILSLGNLYNNMPIKYVTFSLGLIIILVMITKCIFFRDIMKEELNQLVPLSTSGTFSMALMVLSTYVVIYNYILALILWGIGVILHSLIIVIFTYRHVLNNFNIEDVYGSYWIVYIGITMASITGLFLNIQNYSWIFFIFGFIMMIPTFSLVTYRYIFYPVKLEQNKPLICIYAAIFNILIVGYVNSFDVINYYFLIALYLTASICYVFSLYKLINLIRLPFYPSYSAFTFPFVISAIASAMMLMIFEYEILNYIVVFETVIATVMVIYVLIGYIQNYLIN
ncbi:MAG: hypothetical protein BZ135_01500 [Methanosphaera sp. rholeuAM6]|nr:MAG: hypothetical protein BZ135_01500 [Methanosphaera sp. rholeuAM6]